VTHRSADNTWRERSGRLVCLGFDRVSTQQLVARAVIAELVGYLREVRA
jgi:hypothetical protein